MSRRILRPPRVILDLVEIGLYLAEHSLDASDRFVEAVDRDLHCLAETPGMGRAREFPGSSLTGVRSWPVHGFENYLIFYRPIADGIEVLRVLHGARDIEALFED